MHHSVDVYESWLLLAPDLHAANNSAFLPYPLPNRFEYSPLRNAREQIRLFRFETSSPDDATSPEMSGSVSLDAADEEALWGMRIFDGQNLGKQIIGRLETWDIDQAPEYCAISYTWGNISGQATIEVNGRTLEVPASCEEALKQAKVHLHGHIECVWIDALCIQQEDLLEKGHQVFSMGRVYERASKVFACVGSHSEWEDSFFLFSFLQAASDLLAEDKQSPSCVSSTLKSKLEKRTRQELDRLWSALELFGQRHYWHRLWILQELILPRKFEILCGSSRVQHTLMHTFLDVLLELLGDAPVIRTPSKSHTEPYKMLVMEDILRHRATLRLKSRSEGLTPQMALILFRNWKCSYPPDHIFGILRMIKWPAARTPKYAATPDYTATPLQLAVDVLSCFERSWSGVWGLYTAARALIQGLDVTADHSDLRRWIRERQERTTAKRPRFIRSVRHLVWVSGVHDSCMVHRNAHGRMKVSAMRPVEKELLGREKDVNCLQPRWSSDETAEEQRVRIERARSRSLAGIAGTENLDLGVVDPNITQSHRSKTSSGKASICAAAANGDVLLHVGLWQKVHLVLRQYQGNTFEIVGQALINRTSDTCPDSRAGNCACRSSDSNGLGKLTGQRFALHFMPEDLLVLAAQDNLDDRDEADILYLNRVATGVTKWRFSSFAIRQKVQDGVAEPWDKPCWPEAASF